MVQMAVKITELKDQLMKKIDVNDLSQVEKVERYIDLVKSFRKIHGIILKEGETVVTENGAQRFVKAHPLLGERNKINTSLISMEKSFNFEDEPKEVEAGPTSSELLI
jgi:hypothetical protein